MPPRYASSAASAITKEAASPDSQASALSESHPRASASPFAGGTTVQRCISGSRQASTIGAMSSTTTSRRRTTPSVSGGSGGRSFIDHENRGAAHVSLAELRERLVRLLERVRLHLGVDRDPRRQCHELLAVAPRQVRHLPHDALAPEELVRERRDVRHVDAGANHGAALGDRAKRRGNELTGGREDDRRVELLGRVLERTAGPLGAELERKPLSFLVSFTREREGTAALEPG